MLLSLFLLLLVLFLLTAVFEVEVELEADGRRVHPVIRAGLAGLTLTIPPRLLRKVNELVRRRNLHSPEQLLRGLKLGLWLMDSFVQRVQLFHLQAVIGTGDPFWSALSCGGLWSLLGPLFTGLSAGGRLKEAPQITIEPEFERPCLRVYLHCIFSFRLGQIMINELKRAAFAWQART